MEYKDWRCPSCKAPVDSIKHECRLNGKRSHGSPEFDNRWVCSECGRRSMWTTDKHSDDFYTHDSRDRYEAVKAIHRGSPIVITLEVARHCRERISLFGGAIDQEVYEYLSKIIDSAEG